MEAKIVISHTNGMVTTWEGRNWDEYTYVDHCFIVIKDGAWIGIYNMNDVDNIVITDLESKYK